MRTVGWVFAAMFGVGSAWAIGRIGQIRTDIVAFGQYWWVLPLGASVASLSVLSLAAALRGAQGIRRPVTDLTPAYLITGPSISVTNLLSLLSIGASPPWWLGYVMLLCALYAAWIYYVTTCESDEKSRASRKVPSFAFADD